MKHTYTKQISKKKYDRTWNIKKTTSIFHMTTFNQHRTECSPNSCSIKWSDLRMSTHTCRINRLRKKFILRTYCLTCSKLEEIWPSKSDSFFFRLPNRIVVSKLMEWIEIGIVNILLNVICKSENRNGNGNGKKYVKWRDNVLNDIYKRCLVENILNVLEFKLILFKYV